MHLNTMQELSYNAVNISPSAIGTCPARNYLSAETVVTPVSWDNMINASPLNGDSVHFDESASENSDMQVSSSSYNLPHAVNTSGESTLAQDHISNYVEKKRKSGKSNYKHIPHREKPPHLVAKRNARERRRVQAVNSAFARLRKCVPVENRNKRLSKVKTLHKAIEYISQLQEILNTASQPVMHPSNHQSASLNSNHNCHSLSGLNDYAENSASSDQLSSSNHHAGIRSMDCNYLTSGYSQSFSSELVLVGEASTNKENMLDSKWIKSESNANYENSASTYFHHQHPHHLHHHPEQSCPASSISYDIPFHH